MASGVYVDTLPGSRDLDTIIGNGLNASLFTSSLVVPSFTAAGVAYGAGGFAANEVPNGDGYITGGQPVTGLARAFASGELRLSAVDILWTPSAFTGRYCLLSDASDDLAVYLIDFGTDYTSTIALPDFRVQLSLGVLLAYSP